MVEQNPMSEQEAHARYLSTLREQLAGSIERHAQYVADERDHSAQMEKHNIEDFTALIEQAEGWTPQ